MRSDGGARSIQRLVVTETSGKVLLGDVDRTIGAGACFHRAHTASFTESSLVLQFNSYLQ